MTRWVGGCAALTLAIVRIVGGARLGTRPRLPGRPGTLFVMNHQSLLDIALLFSASPECTPKIVTRRRYARWIPLVSHSLRVFEHPLVDPGRMTPDQIASLAEAARTSDTPLAIFPEGTRTRNGEIGPFRRAGLQAMLGARDWDVWVIVGDGMWRCARLHDFVRAVSSVEVRMDAEGPFRFVPGDDVDAFIAGLRDRMVEGLARLRAEAGPA